MRRARLRCSSGGAQASSPFSAPPPPPPLSPSSSSSSPQRAALARRSQPQWERSHGPGAYLEGALVRACRRGRPEEVRAVAQRLLSSLPSLPSEDCVFLLSRLAGTHKDADYWRRAAETFTPRVEELRGDILGLASNVFARSSTPAPGLMRAIAARVQRDLHGLSVKALTLQLHATKHAGENGKLDAAGEGAEAARLLETELAGRLSEMNEQDAALFLSSLGSSGSEALRAICNHGAQALGRLPAPAVAQLVQAFARTSNVDKQLLEELKPLVKLQAHRFPPQSLAMVANAYARLAFLDQGLLGIIAATAARSLSRIDAAQSSSAPTAIASGSVASSRGSVTASIEDGRYDHISVTQLLNAHAKVSFYHDGFFSAALRWMAGRDGTSKASTRLSEFSPQSLANGLHALAKFPQLRRDKALRAPLAAVLDAAAPAIRKRSAEYNVQNLVNAVQAYVVLGRRDPELFGEAGRCLLKLRSQWKTQDVANLSGSFARAQFLDEAAFRAIIDAVPPVVSRFRSDELAVTLNALAHFARRPGLGGEREQVEGMRPVDDVVLPAFHAAASFLDKTKLETYKAFEVALVLNAFAKVQIQATALVSAAVDDLNGRMSSPELVTFSLTLNALARLGQLPPTHLMGASLALLQGPSRARTLQDLDVIRVTSLLNALARLDTPASVPMLDPWLRFLLKRLASMMATPGNTSFQPVDGPAARFRLLHSDGEWNAHTLPAALDAVCSLPPNGKVSQLCSLLLLERIRRLSRRQESRESSVVFDGVALRQIRQSLMAMFLLHERRHGRSSNGLSCGSVTRSQLSERLSFRLKRLCVDAARMVFMEMRSAGPDNSSAEHLAVVESVRAIGRQVSVEVPVMGVYSLDILVNSDGGEVSNG